MSAGNILVFSRTQRTLGLVRTYVHDYYTVQILFRLVTKNITVPNIHLITIDRLALRLYVQSLRFLHEMALLKTKCKGMRGQSCS
jgi:hypothetical protein